MGRVSFSGYRALWPGRGRGPGRWAACPSAPGGCTWWSASFPAGSSQTWTWIPHLLPGWFGKNWLKLKGSQKKIKSAGCASKIPSKVCKDEIFGNTESARGILLGQAELWVRQTQRVLTAQGCWCAEESAKWNKSTEKLKDPTEVPGFWIFGLAGQI